MITDSYNEARKKLVDAEFTSNFESDAELHQRPKRKLKRPFRFYSDSSDSCDNEDAVCNKIPSPPKLRTPTKDNTDLRRTPIMTTPCKPSTSTAVASPKCLSTIAMNYEKSFSNEMNSPKRSSYVASNYNKSISRKMNSPSILSNTAINYTYKKSLSKKINSPRRPPSVAMNYEKSPSRNINSPRRSPIISQKCFSREVRPSQSSSSTSSTSGFDKSGKILI